MDCPALDKRGFTRLQTEPMKRAASPAWLISRDITWLPWWQELILNWVASWSSIGMVMVVSPTGEQQAEWSLPSDLELAKMELEELLES